jgi:hypothetical protein
MRGVLSILIESIALIGLQGECRGQGRPQVHPATRSAPRPALPAAARQSGGRAAPT